MPSFHSNLTPQVFGRVEGEVPEREANMTSMGRWVAARRRAMRLETFPVPQMRRTVAFSWLLDISSSSGLLQFGFIRDRSDEKLYAFLILSSARTFDSIPLHS